MYIVSVLAVVFASWYLVDAQGGQMLMIDPPTIFVMVLFVFTILLGSGFLKDFNNAFRLGLWRKQGNESANELKRAIEAVRLVRKVLVASGLFLLFFELTRILMAMDFDFPGLPSGAGFMLATGLKAPSYASVAILVLLPLESTLQMKLWNIQEESENREIRNAPEESENQERQSAQR